MDKRFGFGANWKNFLKEIDSTKISQAINSLKLNLKINNLEGKTFLDVGCGSGLFSLAAHQLKGSVFSFDFDPTSVDCTKMIKKKYASEKPDWQIQQGSILDAIFISKIGPFDIVYSWGVLHHTGDMWKALINTAGLVKEGGYLFLAIYNDQGGASKRWRIIKRTYNNLPSPLKFVLILFLGVYFNIRHSLALVVNFKNPFNKTLWGEDQKLRGMSRWHDLVDWVGGYPFEVAKPEEIFDFFFQRNFRLLKLKTCGNGHGCNEFIFQLNSSA